PTIVQNGSKLFISPHKVSYMGTNFARGMDVEEGTKIKGVDFMRCFQAQGGENLRFLSALRMGATYPYVLPSVTLPAEPAMQVMDAALFDNFGVADAVHFLHVFRDWISKHTSGVGLVVIRNSAKEQKVKQPEAKSLFQRLFNPLNHFHWAWFNMQDIRNDDLVASANSWLDGKLIEMEFQCAPHHGEQDETSDAHEASLSWHLTTEEKLKILQSIDKPSNRRSLAKLKSFLE
ncbi:MAG: patatin-like phospholipase family protein, partial [Bacteroidota bacterium]